MSAPVPSYQRVIQTAGSVPLDGRIQCTRTDDSSSAQTTAEGTHVWHVPGEWDDPKAAQRCECGLHTWKEEVQ